MFAKFDTDIVKKLMSNPDALLTALIDFQTSTLEAAQVISENNLKAFQDLATKTAENPQHSGVVQSAILKDTYDKNIAVINDLWHSISGSVESK